MTNQKVTSLKYKGRVFLSPAFAASKAKENEEGKTTTLEDLQKAFKHYWATGSHPELGKDAAFARPKEILTIGVRHVHQDNGVYVVSNDRKDYTSTEACWESWRKGKSFVRPASNAFLVYTVTDQRDACIITFIDQDAHDSTEKSEIMEPIIAVSYSFYEKTKSKPMPLDEHGALFDDKWLE